MKIGGQVVNGPSEEVLVLPRSTGDIVFKAQAVLDMSEFQDQVPPPKAPGRMLPGGKWEQNTDSPAYQEQMIQYGRLRMAFIVTRSLIPSEIEWDTVEFDKPNTWPNWEEDLKNSGFSDVEVQRVLVCCIQANSLDESKLEKAREAFLRGQEGPQEKSSGQDTEQPSTQSGTPASDSA